MPNDDEAFLVQAIELAMEASIMPGCGPFGALVVRNGEVLASGSNRVVADRDPTAHAEVIAIRGACVLVGSHELVGCTLYASCEPCPLCASAAHWARLDRVVYAATRSDAQAAGFDDALLYELLAGDPSARAVRTEHHATPHALDPFVRWHANTDRTPY